MVHLSKFSEFYEEMITAVFRMRALWNKTQICGILERFLSKMQGNIVRSVLFQPKPKSFVSLPVNTIEIMIKLPITALNTTY